MRVAWRRLCRLAALAQTATLGIPLLAAGGLLAAGAARAADPEARQLFAPVWRSALVDKGPCALSAVLPPSDAEHCQSFSQRESGGAAIHPGVGILVAGGSDGRLHGFEARSGRPLYSAPLTGSLVARPTLFDDRAYFGTDDAHVISADVTSGHIRWDVTVDAEVTEPVVVDDDLVLVITGTDSVYALKRETGEPQWVHKHPLPRGITLRGQAVPLVVTTAGAEGAKREVIVGHASGRVTFLDRATGQVVVEQSLSGDDAFGDIDADPFVQGTRVVVASQTRGVFALDVATRAAVWHNTEPGIVRLARGGTHIVVAAGPGKVIGIDATTGQTRWRFTFERGAPTRIVVQGRRVHVGSDRGSFFVLDLESGRPLQYIASGGGFAADPALDGDLLVVTSTSGEMTALSSAFLGVAQAGKRAPATGLK